MLYSQYIQFPHPYSLEGELGKDDETIPTSTGTFCKMAEYNLPHLFMVHLTLKCACKGTFGQVLAHGGGEVSGELRAHVDDVLLLAPNSKSHHHMPNPQPNPFHPMPITGTRLA